MTCTDINFSFCFCNVPSILSLIAEDSEDDVTITSQQQKEEDQFMKTGSTKVVGGVDMEESSGPHQELQQDMKDHTVKPECVKKNPDVEHVINKVGISKMKVFGRGRPGCQPVKLSASQNQINVPGTKSIGRGIRLPGSSDCDLKQKPEEKAISSVNLFKMKPSAPDKELVNSPPQLKHGDNCADRPSKQFIGAKSIGRGIGLLSRSDSDFQQTPETVKVPSGSLSNTSNSADKSSSFSSDDNLMHSPLRSKCTDSHSDSSPKQFMGRGIGRGVESIDLSRAVGKPVKDVSKGSPQTRPLLNSVSLEQKSPVSAGSGGSSKSCQFLGRGKGQHENGERKPGLTNKESSKPRQGMESIDVQELFDSAKSMHETLPRMPDVIPRDDPDGTGDGEIQQSSGKFC